MTKDVDGSHETGCSPHDSAECNLCQQPLFLTEDNEWPEDSTPLMCWGCQHEVIGNLAMMTRRLARYSGQMSTDSKLTKQAMNLLQKYGLQGSIVR